VTRLALCHCSYMIEKYQRQEYKQLSPFSAVIVANKTRCKKKSSNRPHSNSNSATYKSKKNGEINAHLHLNY